MLSFRSVFAPYLHEFIRETFIRLQVFEVNLHLLPLGVPFGKPAPVDLCVSFKARALAILREHLVKLRQTMRYLETDLALKVSTLASLQLFKSALDCSFGLLETVKQGLNVDLAVGVTELRLFSNQDAITVFFRL